MAQLDSARGSAFRRNIAWRGDVIPLKAEAGRSPHTNPERQTLKVRRKATGTIYILKSDFSFAQFNTLSTHGTVG